MLEENIAARIRNNSFSRLNRDKRPRALWFRDDKETRADWYLFIEEFAGFLFDWVQILDLSCRESHNESNTLRCSRVLVEVVARWLGAFVDSLVYRLAEVHSLQEKTKAQGKKVRKVSVRNVCHYTHLLGWCHSAKLEEQQPTHGWLKTRWYDPSIKTTDYSGVIEDFSYRKVALLHLKVANLSMGRMHDWSGLWFTRLQIKVF